VRQAYTGLAPAGREAAVAVRSSATAEDLAEASFAGQQDTYLNVVGGSDVVAAVRRCWASLWTDRAVFYRASHGVDPRQVLLAAVVQEMVPAAVSGVLFTANPVTGRRDEAVVELDRGSGVQDPWRVIDVDADEADGRRRVDAESRREEVRALTDLGRREPAPRSNHDARARAAWDPADGRVLDVASTPFDRHRGPPVGKEDGEASCRRDRRPRDVER
jgi:pyruvate,water dikinase